MHQGSQVRTLYRPPRNQWVRAIQRQPATAVRTLYGFSLSGVGLLERMSGAPSGGGKAMANAQGQFTRLIQDSQEYGSDDEHTPP